MNLKPLCHGTLLALILAGGSLAPGQSQTPGPTDYSGFSRFVTSRNIFNPERFPHSGRNASRPRPTNRPRRAALAFAFVGAMEYGKGIFAFFDGNNDDYRKSLQVNGKLAGYTVETITLGGVQLVAGTNSVFLTVGAQMQQGTDGTWDKAEEPVDFSGRTDGSAPVTTTGGGSDTAPAAPAAPAGQMSDTLKRLMMLRQQENK